MKKLRLNQDDLRVESFRTEPGAERRGTVLGHSYMTCYETCDPWYFCRTYQETCHNRGCNTGLTHMCETEGATDCPGQGECSPYTQDRGNTCYGSCTDVEGCTVCGAVC